MTQEVQLRSVTIPPIRSGGNFVPGSIDLEARTIDAIWSTGAEVMRDSFMEGPYTFNLDLGATVRMDRFNAGAPLLNSHDRSSLASVLGVVERAWIENGLGKATVRFSSRDDVEPIWQDVVAGIIRNFSVGAMVFRAVQEERAGELPHVRAIDFEPMELSLLPVGADAGAVALSATQAPVACTIERHVGAKETEMPETPEVIEQAPVAPTVPVVPASNVVELEAARAQARTEATATERKRISDIRLAVQAAKVKPEIAEELISSGATIEAAREQIIAKLAAGETMQTPHIEIGVEHDAPVKVIERMSVALAHRCGAKGIELSEDAKPYRGATLMDLAAELLTLRKVPYNRFDRPGIAKLALSTSDYPSLLENVGNKFLLPQYDAANPTYRQLCSRQDLPDFKTASFLKTGDFPVPQQVGEGGEIKLGYFSESKDTAALGTYGRRVPFTRQAMINDDLGAFTRVMNSWGARIADFENAAFFTLLATVGPTLGDTGAMFNATAVTTAGGHANYTSSGTAISDTSITVGAAQMANQVGGGSTNLGDGIKLNIQPRFLLANPTKRMLAFQYTSPAYVPAAQTSQNPWAGVLTPLLDANVSGNRWWLFADPMMTPNFVYGSLAGAAGPRVETRQGFEIEGVELKVAFDFYVAGIDFRGGYCNAGA